MAQDAEAGESTPMICGEPDERSWLGEAFKIDTRKPDDPSAPILCCPHLRGENRDNKRLGPHESVTEKTFKEMLTASYPFDEAKQNAAILLVKLSLSLYASGMPTYVSEPILSFTATALGLPEVRLAQGYRHLQVSFGCGPALHFRSRQGKNLHRLSKLHKISIAASVAAGKIDARAALTCTDQITHRPPPYGWAIEKLAHVGFSVCASNAIFGGNTDDLGATAIAKVLTMLLVSGMSRVRVLDVQVDLLEPMVAGFVAPLVSTALLGYSSCHAATVFLSVMVVEFPGADLLWGVTELKRGTGAAMVGATRLMLAVVYTMFLAQALSIGWTLSAGIIEHTNPHIYNASGEFWKVESAQCALSTGKCTLEDVGYNALVLVPLVICFSVIVGTHVHDMPFAGICVVLTLLLSYVLNNLELPVMAPVLNAAVLFVGSNLAFMYETVCGKSHMLVLVPVIALLAPGASVFKNVLQSIDSTDGGNAWFNLLMVGTSYAIGEALAFHVWAPLMARKAADRAQATARQLSEEDTVCYEKVRKLLAKTAWAHRLSSPVDQVMSPRVGAS